jgi:hypothetical protein
MTTPRFVHILREETVHEFAQEELDPFGYLLAPNNATAALRAMAESLRATGRAFLVDNGNFTLIGLVRDQFAAKSAELRSQIASLEMRLGRSVRSSDLPSDLLSTYLDLSRRVRETTQAISGNGEAMLTEQLALDPTHLVGVEDITMAAWLSLNIESVYTGRPRRDYRRYNKSVARRARERLDALPDGLSDSYYPVASAVCYNTAKDAGREFGAAGIAKAAMGFGAYMADDNFTDHMFIERRRVDFPGRLPTRYSRTAAAACGFWDGYQEETGRAPEAFHFLGLGAPIMLPLVTLAASATENLTFDATSPIKDALQGGTLYVTKPAYLKIRTRKIAHRLASDPTHAWDCPCPFCEAFVTEHPFRYDLGHRWFADENGRDVVAQDLRPGGGLFDAYPLLSEPSSGILRTAVSFSRIGHNHWAIEVVLAALRRASRAGKLDEHVRDVVDAYVPNTTTPFADAVRIGVQIVTGELSAQE